MFQLLSCVRFLDFVYIFWCLVVQLFVLCRRSNYAEDRMLTKFWSTWSLLLMCVPTLTKAWSSGSLTRGTMCDLVLTVNLPITLRLGLLTMNKFLFMKTSTKFGLTPHMLTRPRLPAFRYYSANMLDLIVPFII